MTIQQLVPAPETRVEFSLKSRKFLPATAGCYALSNFQLDVLYVGLTNNLQQRFVAHRESKAKREPTAAGVAYWFYYLCCEQRELHRIERTWLNIHMEMHAALPLLNKMNSPLS